MADICLGQVSLGEVILRGDVGEKKERIFVNSWLIYVQKVT